MRLIFAILLIVLIICVDAKKKSSRKSNRAEGSGQDPVEECKDLVKTCKGVKQYCQNYKLRSVLQQNCKKTCGQCGQKKCKDNNKLCKYWIKNGYCKSPFYSKEDKEYSCRKSCKYCK